MEAFKSQYQSHCRTALISTSFGKREEILRQKVTNRNVSRMMSFQETFPFPITTKYAHGATWLKIFHHSTDYGYFTIDTTTYSLKEMKFSILKFLTDDFMFQGKFEFLYECPDGINSLLYNRWRQTNNPLKEIEKSDFVEGFEFDPGSAWPYAATYSFTGLALSDVNRSLLDGTSLVNDKWFFSIGVYNSTNIEGTIPGYSWNTEIVLWVRVPDNFLSMRLTMIMKICTFFLPPLLID